MVEAAGIEPASESTPLFGSTCLSRALSSSGGSSTGPLPAGPSPNESRLPPSERHGRPADFFGGTFRGHRLGSGVPLALGVLVGHAVIDIYCWGLFLLR